MYTGKSHYFLVMKTLLTYSKRTHEAASKGNSKTWDLNEDRELKWCTRKHSATITECVFETIIRVYVAHNIWKFVYEWAT